MFSNVPFYKKGLSKQSFANTALYVIRSAASGQFLRISTQYNIKTVKLCSIQWRSWILTRSMERHSVMGFCLNCYYTATKGNLLVKQGIYTHIIRTSITRLGHISLSNSGIKILMKSFREMKNYIRQQHALNLPQRTQNNCHASWMFRNYHLSVYHLTWDIFLTSFIMVGSSLRAENIDK